MFVMSKVQFHVLLIICVPCLASCLLDVKEDYIIFNENGSMARESEVPECTSGGGINILSYKYYKRTCKPICLNLASNYLSSEAEIKLYDACSLKAKCTDMNALSRDVKQQNFNAIYIKYQCKDLDKSFLDVCRDDEQLVQAETNIVLNTTKQNLKDCSCFISGEDFSVSVNDIRLQSKLGENCSLSIVRIQSTEFSCEQDDAPIFKRNMENSVKNAYIAVTINGVGAVPRMMWLIIIPNDGTTALIKCSTSSMLESSVTTTPETKYPSTLANKMLRSKEEGDSVIDKVIPVVSVIGLVGVLAVLFYYRRKRRRSSRDHNATNFEEVEDDNVEIRHLPANKNALVNPTENVFLKGQSEVSEEKGQTDNVYSCINDMFSSKTDNSDGCIDYDTTNNAKPICQSLGYHSLSQTSNCRPTISLQYKQNGTTYSIAKCVDQQ